MKTRILVSQMENRIVNSNRCAVFFGFTGEVCPKLNTMLAKRKWIIFDNK